MERKVGKLPPLPKSISPEEVRLVFEGRGFTTVSEKRISADLYDILAPLLRILQCVQWWGRIGEINQFVPLELTGERAPRGLTTHSAGRGQDICTVPINTIQSVLNMPKAYLEALRHYGTDPTLRAQRVQDVGYAEVENENLDTHAETLLQLLALVLPPSSEEDESKSQGGAAE